MRYSDFRSAAANTACAILMRVSIAIGLLAALCPAGAVAGDFWLAAVDPLVRRETKSSSSQDYLDLFKPDAPWQAAAGVIGVVKISTQFAGRGDEQALRQLIADLQRRQIALGMEALMLPRPVNCGDHVEGYTGAGGMERVAQRIKSLGGELRFVAMDEPLFFGHQYAGPSACHASIDDVARSVAAGVADLTRIFPDIRVGDIEPIGSGAGAGWMSALAAWPDAYARATGRKLAFLHADIDWSTPWKKDLGTLAASVRGQGIRFGVIFDGSSTDATDEAWTNSALRRFEAVEAGPALKPDDVVFQTWMERPTKLLPEDRPGTLTNLVRRALQPAPVLEARAREGDVKGRLTDASGGPIAGAEIAVTGQQPQSSNVNTERTMTGTVPANAATALFVLRINVECGCSGVADAIIGPMRYREGSASSDLPSSFSVAADKPGSPKPHFTAAPGQPIQQNGKPFPVTPGAPFTARIELGATAGSSDSGYVGLVFLDRNQKEVHREKQWLQPADAALGTAVTDRDGRFELKPAKSLPASSWAVRAQYAGDAARRGTVAPVH